MDTRPIYAPSDFRLGDDGLAGVQRGNDDLVGTGTWAPPAERECAPLPVYPQTFDPLFEELDQLLARIREMVAECPPAYAGEERRA
ncbi:hypothetical protein ACFONC_11845 [Luteimonas soli]|uniref:Uncharacterized protein n=1 Tax=Luteimonas soli TaxID=1648966 RepID=A0ABV7XNX0_9GAMM